MNLQDTCGRRFAYLRLSVTDRCNFRCQYCLPNGYQKTSCIPYLSVDEIARLARAFSGLGLWKIRLTGGEPTVRADLPAIIARLSAVAGVRRLAMTTNGYNLARHAAFWQQAGLQALNISIDSLKAERFEAITGHDKLNDVLHGLDIARAAGFESIKINTVLLRDVNDDEVNNFIEWSKRDSVHLRFIELMQTGSNEDYFKRHHISTEYVQEKLLADGWQLQKRNEADGPAAVYKHVGFEGSIGLIAPYCRDFCVGCNRLRVTARGELRLCLFGEANYSLRDLLQDDGHCEALQQRVVNLLGRKVATHHLHEGATGITSNLAQLGG